MNKKEFLKLNADQRANYMNSEMKSGKSFNQVCKDLDNLSTSQYTYLEKHGYKLEKNQFIKQHIEGQESFLNINTDVSNRLQVQDKTTNDIIKPIEAIEEPQEDEKATKVANVPLEVEEPKRGKGRPQIHKKGDRSKMTFEINNKIIKALKLKKVLEGLTLNDYIEQLLNDNIEPKYFDMVDK